MAFDYARGRAPRDVLDCPDRLVAEDFAFVGERGGPDESFGSAFDSDRYQRLRRIQALAKAGHLDGRLTQMRPGRLVPVHEGRLRVRGKD